MRNYLNYLLMSDYYCLYAAEADYNYWLEDEVVDKNY